MNYSNLPEVVPDTAPEALSQAEAYDRAGSDVRDQKYTVQGANSGSSAPDSTPTPFHPSSVSPSTPAPPYKPPLSDFQAGNYPESMGGGAGVAVVDWENSQRQPGSGVQDVGSQPPSTKDDGRRICGLKRKIFFIILALILVVIAVAVGGGVGGAAAAKNKAEKASEEAEAADDSSTPSVTADTAENTASRASTTSPSTTSAPTKTSASTSASATTTSSESIFDLVYSFEAHSGTEYTGRSTVLRGEPGFIDLPFNVTSYKWDPNKSDCCITFCQGNSKSVGWRCTKFDREVSTAPFDRLFIGCGKDAAEENSRCSS
ncbi:hypothetical protein jhhlp_003768 [Lomentospora prolificans]|uniref:Uncharacterized protein n=1 Tax=Lomentospora prolificans TaxID=41688 RepID=A0A2N3N9R5_9PEZI|nr:hypothetical protein jhhlp_003768 [Lomentospora prolificans]